MGVFSPGKPFKYSERKSRTMTYGRVADLVMFGGVFSERKMFLLRWKKENYEGFGEYRGRDGRVWVRRQVNENVTFVDEKGFPYDRRVIRDLIVLVGVTLFCCRVSFLRMTYYWNFISYT